MKGENNVDCNGSLLGADCLSGKCFVRDDLQLLGKTIGVCVEGDASQGDKSPLCGNDSYCGYLTGASKNCYDKGNIGMDCPPKKIENKNFNLCDLVKAEDTCRSGYCDPKTNRCAPNPNCDPKKQYKMGTGFPGLGGKGACVDIDTGIGKFFESIVSFIFGSVGTLAVLVIIIAGFMWAFAAGNPNMIGKETLINAIEH